jgi:hypothetical protein
MKFGRAIQRVDDPHVLAVRGAAAAARLLGQDAVPGIGAEQRVDHRDLGGMVDLRDEVVRRLGVDLQPVDVERGAVDDRPGSARRPDGGVEHGVQRLRHEAGSGALRTLQNERHPFYLSCLSTPPASSSSARATPATSARRRGQ